MYNSCFMINCNVKVMGKKHKSSKSYVNVSDAAPHVGILKFKYNTVAHMSYNQALYRDR